MKRIFIFTFLLLLAVRVVSAATVDTLAVHSPSMDRDVPVVAIVPEAYPPLSPVRWSTCCTATRAMRRHG